MINEAELRCDESRACYRRGCESCVRYERDYQRSRRERSRQEVNASRATADERAMWARVFQPVDWMEHAACKGMDLAMFFPGQGGDTRTPIAVCKECPVRAQCLDYALENDDHHGIWGGTSERGRQSIRKLRRPESVRQIAESLL